MNCSRRSRLRIALAVIACLLFQQVAMAAYACTLPVTLPIAPPAAAMAEDCADRGMAAVQEIPALCAEHCSPDHAVVTDATSLHVPPVALPSLQFAAVVIAPRARAALVADVAIDRSDPPPRLRYCSLLI